MSNNHQVDQSEESFSTRHQRLSIFDYVFAGTIVINLVIAIVFALKIGGMIGWALIVTNCVGLGAILGFRFLSSRRLAGYGSLQIYTLMLMIMITSFLIAAGHPNSAFLPTQPNPPATDEELLGNLRN